MEDKKKVLLVDDEEVFLEQLKDALENSSLDLQIDTASDGVEALEKIEANHHDIVITDVKMPRMDGYSLLKEIQNRFPSTYVVVITAFGSISGAVEAIKYGAYDFLEKPFNMDSLEISLTKILRQHEILKENIELKGQIQQHTEGLDQLVGSHPKMQRLYEQILTASETDLTVLILGETGTGKELIARSIHSRSDRRSKPFVVINCAAIPENLLESEFFGHEKGAFSGAISQRIGKFEKAHTGTLFLDEIGDIPLDLQAKILRVIEDHKITRIGSNREVESGLPGDLRHEPAHPGHDQEGAFQGRPLLPHQRLPHHRATSAGSEGRYLAALRPFYRQECQEAQLQCKGDLAKGHGSAYRIPVAGQCQGAGEQYPACHGLYPRRAHHRIPRTA